MPLLLVAGCGSFGLQSIELVAEEGHIGATPTYELDFGKAVVGGDPKEDTITLKCNDDDDNVTITDVWLEGGNGAFDIGSRARFPRTLRPRQTYDVDLFFEPGARGSFSGTFLAVTEGGVTLERKLSGEGCRDNNGDDRCDD